MINPQLLRESQIKDFNSLSRIQILTFTHFSEYIDSTVFLLYVAVLLSLPQNITYYFYSSLASFEVFYGKTI